MKKFYSTAIAALCALGVSATINVRQERTDFMGMHHTIATKSPNLKETSSIPSLKNIELRKIKSRAEGDAEDLTSIAGDYYIYIGDLFWKESIGDVQEVATIEQEGNDIAIDCDFFATPFFGKYDETTGTITFSKTKMGEVTIRVSATETKQFYLRLEPISGVDNSGYPIIKDFEATFDAENGIIEFPELCGFGWMLYSDSKYGLLESYLDLLIIYGLEDISNWDFLGYGVFTDNAMAPAFGTTVNPYEVEVYQDAYNSAVYKVINPWKGLYSALGAQTISPTIYLDATDKDNVLLDLTPAGIYGGEEDGYYYVYNDGWISAENNLVPDAYTTLTESNGVKTFTFEPESLILMASATRDAYVLGEQATTLVITSDANSGVSDVAVDENAPVEYFNLQGVRISKPAAGQVVIKRQGSKVTKTLVR